MIISQTKLFVGGLNWQMRGNDLREEFSPYGEIIFARVNLDRETKRSSKGVKTLNISDKNGKIISFKSTNNEQDLMIITTHGIIIRLDVNSISQMGRVTKGVKLINLKDDNKVASISLVDKEEEETEETSSENSPVEQEKED